MEMTIAPSLLHEGENDTGDDADDNRRTMLGHH
jgi:hypothetical protein